MLSFFYWLLAAKILLFVNNFAISLIHFSISVKDVLSIIMRQPVGFCLYLLSNNEKKVTFDALYTDCQV